MNLLHSDRQLQWISWGSSFLLHLLLFLLLVWMYLPSVSLGDGDPVHTGYAAGRQETTAIRLAWAPAESSSVTSDSASLSVPQPPQKTPKTNAQAAPAPPVHTASATASPGTGGAVSGMASGAPSGKESGPSSLPGDRPGASLGGGGRIAPVYPKTALNNEWAGTVKVKVTVNASGLPVMVTVVDSSGYAILDEQFKRTILEKYRYLPKRVMGNDVEDIVLETYTFSLQ